MWEISEGDAKLLYAMKLLEFFVHTGKSGEFRHFNVIRFSKRSSQILSFLLMNTYAKIAGVELNSTHCKCDSIENFNSSKANGHIGSISVSSEAPN